MYKRFRSSSRISRLRGFTMIEVMLFLALSGMLMVGLIASTNQSISRQRYNDSMNDFGEFLRGVYADAINISNNTSDGRTDRAFYGKFIVFNSSRTGSSSTIDIYDIVGDAISSSKIKSTTPLLKLLFEPASAAPPNEVRLNANIGFNVSDAGIADYKPYQKSSHTVPWESTLENSDGSSFTGVVMILRSPITGTVSTYASPAEPAQFSGADTDSQSFFAKFAEYAKDATPARIDICLDSPDNSYGRRRDFRIKANASGSSGVEMVALDSADSVCAGHAGD